MSNESRVTSLLWLAGGWLATTLAVWTIAEDQSLAPQFVSVPTWLTAVSWLGGTGPTAESPGYASVPLVSVLVLVAIVLAVGVGLLTWRNGSTDTACRRVGQLALVPGVWLVGYYALLLSGWAGGFALVASLPDLVFPLTVAVGLTWVLKREHAADVSPRNAAWCLTGMIAAYVVVFTAMNWGQYWNLRTPHGDTAMYEEHLYNVLHGKGFRSYLDQGLFLGEHIQVVHLLLIPVYAFFQSHLTLEFCESLALASAAIPTYRIALRHGDNRRVALWVAAAVLLYAPLHYLDIEIDRKSFRPICFGVPAMLWAFEFLERRQWKRFVAAAVIAVMSKEDYTLVLGPLGLWWALRIEGRESKTETLVFRRFSPSQLRQGAAITLASGLYLLLAVKVIIPWFRGGETVHYARYFSQFGETPTGILWGMLTKPGVLWASLVTPLTVSYVLRTFAPLGFTPLLSPSRLLVGVPLLGLLLLNQLSLDPPAPVHHFHAPLVPVLMWAMAVGIASRTRTRQAADSGEEEGVGREALGVGNRPTSDTTPHSSLLTLHSRHWPAMAALLTGVTLSFGPLSTKFWDAGSGSYWRRVYVPDERVEQFAKVLKAIPQDARVASTDYVHPRFTHHKRSYDYSGYVREVADYEDRVPEDTDYIVLDVRGPYSEIRGPGDVRELQQTPSDWELMPLETKGYFLVLRRKNGRAAQQTPE